MKKEFSNPHGIYLEPVKHQYFDKNGLEWTSQSKFMRTFKEAFDAEAILPFSAKKQLKESGIIYPTETQMAEKVTELRQEWEGAGTKATDTGTNMHEALELYQTTTQIEEKNLQLEQPIRAISSLFNEYSKSFCEQILWWTNGGNIRICGTTDKACITKNRGVDVDYADYKTYTNEKPYFHNAYKKMLLPPLSHLEDCDYIKHALQLSTYAFMGEMSCGLRPGKLFVVRIPVRNPENFKVVHVPYMKLEVQAMFNYYISLQKPESYAIAI